jgi:hypothetical protein
MRVEKRPQPLHVAVGHALAAAADLLAGALDLHEIALRQLHLVPGDAGHDRASFIIRAKLRS